MTRMSDTACRTDILPRDKGAAPLDLVIGVMAFLAALALGGVLIAQRTAESWQAGLGGPADRADSPAGEGAADNLSGDRCRARRVARDARHRLCRAAVA